MAELSLARDFPPADEAAWKALVEEALKGAPVSRRSHRGAMTASPSSRSMPRAKDAHVIAGRARRRSLGR